MRRWLAIGLAVAVVAAGCAEPPVSVLEPEPEIEHGGASDPDAPSIDWQRNDDGVESGYLEVPIDYSNPDAGTLEVFVARRPAGDPRQRIGSMLVNPGGPGFGGADYAAFAPQIFDSELLDRFDIVGWDPRGTGMSNPSIDCIDDYDLYYASLDTAADPAGESERLARRFVEGCLERSGDILDHVGTNNSARDMDMIRRALGEEQISYFGFSYGSELGGVWATLFPGTVRAAVFDGAADPTADALESSLQQIAGFESTLGTFLANCSARPTCRFHNDGDAAGAFSALMSALDESPIPSLPGRPDVGRGVATNGVIMAMYAESFWPQLERALADAQNGDGAGLLALHDTYYQYEGNGRWGDELEAFQVISCADVEERPTVAELQASTPLFHAAAPRLVPIDAEPGFFCTFFPPALDPRIDITGAGAGPIVVLGATGDPTTPIDSTRAMAGALADSRLVELDSNNHGTYFTSWCVRRIVADYFVKGIVPEDGTFCPN